MIGSHQHFFLSINLAVFCGMVCVNHAEEEVARAVSPAALASISEPSDKPKTFTSTSFSKQFRVTGLDSNLCSALSTKADEIRGGLFHLLKIPKDQQNGWTYPIGIRLYGAPGEPSPAKPIRPSITMTEGGDDLELAINIHLGKGIDLDELSKTVTLMVLYEMSLRNMDPGALPDVISLPPWLLYGIDQALLWKTDRLNRDTYAALFSREDILQPDEILSHKNPEEEMDATSFAAYKASCGALIMCLLGQDSGEEAVLRVFDEAILGNDDAQHLLKRNFPQLSLTPSSLHKWWTLQLSSLAAPSATESLSISDTERRLNEILVLVRMSPETRISTLIGFNRIDEILNIPNYKRQFAGISQNLVYLSQRCFPSYAPIIVEYAKIITDLQTKKIKPELMQKRLDDLMNLRSLSVKVGSRARDYLDWYEITERAEQSDTFDSYMKTMQILRETESGSETPLSRYLKDVEDLYLLPANAPTPALSRNAK